MKVTKQEIKKSLSLFRELRSAPFDPPPETSVSEWADSKRILSKEGSAQPGRWDTSHAEYQREMMNAFSDPRVRKVVSVMSTQSGKTESLIFNPLGYTIDLNPQPCLIVFPKDGEIKKFSMTKLQPMIRDTPCLREKIGIRKRKSEDFSTAMIKFPGGYVAIVGAKSVINLKGWSVGVVWFDEVDSAEETPEGDPVEIASDRLKTFPNSKLVLTSSPTDEGSSRIMFAYEDSTKEKWFTPCPECNHYQVLEWERFNLDTVCHRCEKCDKEFNQVKWNGAAKRGKWIAQKQHPTTRGFHISGLDSPWENWEELVRKYRRAIEAKEQGDYGKLRAFVNTVLARLWRNQAEKLDPDDLRKRRHIFKEEVPEGVLVLTCGVDVQDNRLEYFVVGWGVGREAWGIEYGRIRGNTQGSEVWQELDKAVYNREFTDCKGRKIKASRIFVDSGGHATPHVYQYAQKRQPRVMAIKGAGGVGIPPVKHVTFTMKERAPLAILGVDTIKDEIVGRLRVDTHGPGFVHIPILQNGNSARGFDDEFYRGITSERRIAVYKNGYRKLVWDKPDHEPNEAMDCFGYAFGALEELGGLRNLEDLEKRAKTDFEEVVGPQLGVSDKKSFEVGKVSASPEGKTQKWGVYKRF